MTWSRTQQHINKFCLFYCSVVVHFSHIGVSSCSAFWKVTNLRKQYGLSSQLAKQNHLRSFPSLFRGQASLPSAPCCDVSVVPILRRSPTERTSQVSTKPRRPTNTYRTGRVCLGKYNTGLIQRLSLRDRNGSNYIFAMPIKRFTIPCIFFLHWCLFLVIDKEEVRVTLETSAKCSVWASKGMSVKMLYPDFALIELPSVYWKRNRSPLWALLEFLVFFFFLNYFVLFLMYHRNFRRLRNHQGLNYMSGNTGTHALKKQSLSRAPICNALNTFRDDIGKKNMRCPTFKVPI